MAKKEFTPEQLKAINTRDKTLLVSAAAGSGKTATLTERIIRSILDEKNPEDVSRMLIVTFTNAAVRELRDRITDAVRTRLLDDPTNERLIRQLHLLPSARICTIDSFCGEVLRMNAERFGISPSYRIADTVEAKLLCHTIISALIDSIYKSEAEDVATPEELERLAAALTGVKNDSALEESIEELYEKTKSLEEGVLIFDRFAEEFSDFADEATPLSKNRYCSYAIQRVHEAAAHYKGVFEALLPTLNLGTKEEAGYIDTLKADIALFDAFLSESEYSQVAALFPEKYKSLPTVRGDKLPSLITVGAAREKMKDTLKKLKEKYFLYSEEEWREHLSALSSLTGTLARFLKKLDSVYFEEKRRRSMLEYSDVERLAYISLYNPDGSYTDVAESLRESFSSVYIDEYQDVNALQNKIFEAVAKENNRFMVGDIKQSIYGFRSAKPEIFADMKKSFPDLDVAEGSSTASIFMSDNFRSDKCVIDFANEVFDVMFTLARESIGYVDADRLNYKKIQEWGEPEYIAPEITVFDSTSSKTADKNEDDEEQEELAAKDLPPIFTAKKIKELLDTGRLNSGERIQPKDIAIILRSDRGRAAAYAKELTSLGIRTAVPDDKDFFLNAEIQLTLCLLNAINNPKRDIYLAGLMLSPLFDFTADELYIIKSSTGNALLWDAAVLYSAANPENAKLKSFIDTLCRYRELAEGVKVDALLLRLYNETGLLALAEAKGKKENLMLLYSYARGFESSSLEGLYSFISYINTVIETDNEFAAKKSGGEENAVTIITVHKSKGLEYPIVFIGDAGKALSKGASRSKAVYSEGFGFAMRERAPVGLALIESPVYNAIGDYTADRELEEELRVYYVALTRARERLFITGAVESKDIEEYFEKAKLKRLNITSFTLREMGSLIDMILCSVREPKITIGKDAREAPDAVEQAEMEEASEKDGELCKKLAERFAFEYPDLHLTLLPEKMSISRLYPNVLDGLEDEEERLTLDELKQEKKEREEERSRRPHLPEFITGTHEDESARRGIATHNFLQFFNFESFDTLGAKGELDRLKNDGFISEENAKRVRLGEIELFARSELYRRMKGAKSLWREFRFNVMLPAELFTENEEKREALKGREILMQGVIDCIIEDGEGNLHLVDYKTDRLTKEELAEKTLAASTLAKKHSLQLSYYALAIERIFGKAPITRRVYSLALGDTVDV